MQKELLCGELIKRLHDKLEKNANNELKKIGITFSQMNMLAALGVRSDHSATLKELERHFDVSQASIAGVASRLEDKGLIVGYLDASDKRIKHVKLTQAGLKLCLDTKHSVDQTETQLLSVLSDDEKKEFHRLLKKIYNQAE